MLKDGEKEAGGKERMENGFSLLFLLFLLFFVVFVLSECFRCVGKKMYDNEV
jgi:hypothetical protein